MVSRILTVLVMLLMVPWTAGAQGVPTGFLNRTLAIDGETYRYQVFVPSTYTPDRRWPVMLFLHGGGEEGFDGLLQTEVGLGSAVRRQASRFSAVIVFPQARPGAAWAGPMATAALAALDATEREFMIDKDREYLTGLSRGGSGTWWIASRHPDRFAALLVVCGRIRPSATTTDPVVPATEGEPFAALAGKVKHLPIWIFHGDADPTVPVDESRGISAALTALSAPVKFTELPGIGHNAWDTAYRSAEAIEWLLGQKRESRR